MWLNTGMKKKDGSYIWVHDLGRSTIAEDGESRHFFCLY